MLLAYNTNGFAHHAPDDAISLLAEIGYRGVGITLDRGWLNPWSPDFSESVSAMRKLLDRHQLRSVVETGARFLLDPRRKHEPTLVSADPGGRARRIEFLYRAIDVAHALESDCVSLWSGILREPIVVDVGIDRLVDGLRRVCEYADANGVIVGFEPEPGMLIDTMPMFERLLERLDSPALKLTLDIGHLHCQGETPLAPQIHRWSDRLVNVHIEDMRRGVHEHLMFGEGEIDFPPVIRELASVDYRGLVQVELSRHSHQAPEAARAAFDFLQPLISPSTQVRHPA